MHGTQFVLLFSGQVLTVLHTTASAHLDCPRVQSSKPSLLIHTRAASQPHMVLHKVRSTLQRSRSVLGSGTRRVAALTILALVDDDSY